MKRKQKLDIIKSTNGNFFSVKFLKKGGELREMNCRLGVKYPLKGGENTLTAYPQYITVFDMQKQDYRTINLDTLLCIKTGKVEINFPEISLKEEKTQ